MLCGTCRMLIGYSWVNYSAPGIYGPVHLVRCKKDALGRYARLCAAGMRAYAPHGGQTTIKIIHKMKDTHLYTSTRAFLKLAFLREASLL